MITKTKIKIGEKYYSDEWDIEILVLMRTEVPGQFLVNQWLGAPRGYRVAAMSDEDIAGDYRIVIDHASEKEVAKREKIDGLAHHIAVVGLSDLSDEDIARAFALSKSSTAGTDFDDGIFFS